MRGREAGPDWLLRAYRLAGEDVRWATQAELVTRPLRSKRTVPFGEPAGSKPVLGRGRLTRFAGFNLLTRDLAIALSFGPRDERLWWNYNGTQPDGEAGPNDDAATALIVATWHLDGRGALRWLISPHSTIPACSLARGTHLAGRNDAALSYKGAIYVSSDVEHVLRHGRLPWGPATLAWD